MVLQSSYFVSVQYLLHTHKLTTMLLVLGYFID